MHELLWMSPEKDSWQRGISLSSPEFLERLHTSGEGGRKKPQDGISAASHEESLTLYTSVAWTFVLLRWTQLLLRTTTDEKTSGSAASMVFQEQWGQRPRVHEKTRALYRRVALLVNSIDRGSWLNTWHGDAPILYICENGVPGESHIIYHHSFLLVEESWEHKAKTHTQCGNDTLLDKADVYRQLA